MTKLSAKAARVRASFAARTGMDSRACKILVAAHQVKIQFYEDEDGNLIRAWKANELQSYTNADLKQCLSNRVAFETNDMLGTVPPSAIKYCVTKGWLIPRGSLFLVTMKSARELDLPMRFRGLHNGRKIPFAS
jgi:hypothetical protein